MWIFWALIIFGGVWDAADSITLRHAQSDQCVSARGQLHSYKVYVTKCRTGSDGQTWLWEGKRLKNKLAGRCIVVYSDDDYDNQLDECSIELKGAPKKFYADHDERTEYTRFGQHGLKNSKGKCLKFPKTSDEQMRLGNCTDDKFDPYYE
jgi:hypothetical protein